MANELNTFQDYKLKIDIKDWNDDEYKTKDFYKFLYNDFLNFGNNLIYLLSLNSDSEKNDFFIDIESDTQYEKNNIFYAEGDAVIYFSNAILRGDKIIYDKVQKTLTILGKVSFSKGNQYFEATKVFYNLKNKNGFIDNIYGILDVNSSIFDFEFKNVKKADEAENLNKVSDLKYINAASIGIVNDYEAYKNFNLTELNFEFPSITKWRYKSKKIILEDYILKSKEIFFTNDALNKPQLILKSKNFTGEIVDEKIKLVSNNSSIILDDIVTVPIGKKTIFDEEDSFSAWGIGADHKEKDGWYISRSFQEKTFSKDLKIKMRSYFLIQRALNGNTNAFRAKDASILSNKVNNTALASDYFGLDADLSGKVNEWNLSWKNKFNSFNINRFPEAVRSKITLYKTIDLNKNNNINLKDHRVDNFKPDLDIKDDSYLNDLPRDKVNLTEVYKNKLNLKISSSYREKLSKGYSGESEIYFGNALSIANKKSWTKGDRLKELSFISDVGRFKAKSNNKNKFNDLYRTVLAARYRSSFPLWKRKAKDININNDHRYTNILIKEGVNWNTNILSAIFLYSDGSKQENLSFSMGPKIKIGSLKNNFLDYTYLNITGDYFLKGGESPFEFDNINNDFKINFQLKQQLLGPLVFSYSRSYNVDDSKYSKPIYGMEISRRAYKIGTFYNQSNQSFGFRFNIFNFDYSGRSSEF